MVRNANVREFPWIAIFQHLMITKVNGLCGTKRILKEEASVQAPGQETLATSVTRRHKDFSVLVDQERPTTVATETSLDLRNGVDESNGSGAVNGATRCNSRIGPPDQHGPKMSVGIAEVKHPTISHHAGIPPMPWNRLTCVEASCDVR